MPDFVAFNDFIERVASAKFQQHRATLERGLLRLAGVAGSALGAVAGSAGSVLDRLTGGAGDGILSSLGATVGTAVRAVMDQVDPKEEFQKMQDFLLDYYKGVEIQHTFVDKSGNHVDCIPIEQQATYRKARAGRHKVSAKPVKPTTKVKRVRRKAGDFGPENTSVMPPLRRGVRDLFDNSISCPEGCVPVRRITLSSLAFLGKFDNFFTKSMPAPAAPAAALPLPADHTGPDGRIHRYAVASGPSGAGAQYFGCGTYLNIWNPDPSPGEMSLSQLWIVRDMGSGKLQTVESGWQVQPVRTRTTAPVLFIFFTADSYKPQSSGYLVNPSGQGFIQTNSDWVIGSDLPASTMAGQQLGFRLQWERKATGDWVLFIGGDNEADPPTELGFFPGFLYKGGDSFGAFNRVQFGGEVATLPNSRSTGQMGSGSTPLDPLAENFRRVAFQRHVSVQTSQGGQWTPVSLTEDNRWAPSYKIVTSQSSFWGNFLFFGGSGAS
jgi:hypothetical protein